MVSILKSLMAILLLLTMYWPTVNNTFTLLCVVGCATYFAYNALQSKKYVWGSVYLIFSCLFILMNFINLSQGIWTLICTVSAMVFTIDVFSSYFLSPRKEEISNKKEDLGAPTNVDFPHLSQASRELINKALFYAKEKNNTKAEDFLKSAISMWDRLDDRAYALEICPSRHVLVKTQELEDNYLDEIQMLVQNEVEKVTNANFEKLQILVKEEIKEITNKVSKEVLEVKDSNTREIQKIKTEVITCKEDLEKSVCQKLKEIENSNSGKSQVLINNEIKNAKEIINNDLRKVQNDNLSKLQEFIFKREKVINASICKIQEALKARLETKNSHQSSLSIDEVQRLARKEVRKIVDASLNGFRELMYKEIKEIYNVLRTYLRTN